MKVYVTGAYGQQMRALSVADEASVLLNTREGETVVYEEPPSESHWWDGEQWQGRGEPPSPSAQWDKVTHNWYVVEPEAIPLSTLQAAKWEAIKLLRSQAEQAPVFINGSLFDADTLSLQRISSTIQYAQIVGGASGWSTVWTTADNKPVTVDINTLIAVGVAIGRQVMAVHAYGRTLREAIDSSTSAEELEAIEWAYTEDFQ